MHWRVIVRVSLTGSGKQHVRLRNDIKECLGKCGIHPSGALATYEGHAVSAKDASRQFAEVFKLLGDPQNVGGRWSVALDHLWIYIDKAKNPPIKKQIL
jgi:hypothetical protein